MTGRELVLVVVDHDRGAPAPAVDEALTAGRRLAASTARRLAAITIGAAADGLVDHLARFGVAEVHQSHHELLGDYGPETWGAAVAEAVGVLEPEVVLAPGTDRGNEVLAQAVARLDVPMVANCVDLGDLRHVTRARWGGSLLEHAELDAAVAVLTLAPHAVEAEPLATAPDVEVLELTPVLDDGLGRSVVRSRVGREAGLTLTTAPVVVGGGRGVGSADGFASLEELAALVGGAVGCSRAVTNNGWRNHTDQVGQTGTRIAPVVYLACGISGAIQHWIGAAASKHIIAVNIDPEANMVARAGYAVIGDLHEVVPAISAEIRRRSS